MPIDHFSVAFAGNSAAASMRCEVVSYERRQILLFRSVRIYNTSRRSEAINGCFRPNWFSSTTGSMIASRRRRLTATHPAGQLPRISIIQICRGHVGANVPLGPNPFVLAAMLQCLCQMGVPTWKRKWVIEGRPYQFDAEIGYHGVQIGGLMQAAAGHRGWFSNRARQGLSEHQTTNLGVGRSNRSGRAIYQ
jgi:hypothetical protein